MAYLATLAVAVVVWPASAPGGHDVAGTQVWGYEAAFGGARILEYDIGADTFVSSCVPDATANGRGIAYDPFDGNLWYTRLSAFAGDGMIHKVTPPPACVPLPSIPFGDGPGGTVQDDIGALDIDPDDGHIWAAGYAGASGFSTNPQILYKVDRVSGAILKSCTVSGPPNANDTIAVVKLTGLSGSGKYILTDAADPGGAPLLVLDEATCTGGAAATVVATLPMPIGSLTGIDLEGGPLIASNLSTLESLDGYPFVASIASMSTAPSFGVEDITLQTAPIVLEVDIDIKPGSFPNSIKLSNSGVVPVAILSTATFDATTVDPSTVCFGDAEDASQRDCTEAHGTGHIEDVNGDLLPDLVLHFETSETGIDPGDTEACLTGQTFGGQNVAGCDSVRTL